MNKTLRFFIKLFAVILCVAAVVGILNYFYKNDYYYLDVYGEIEKMYDVPANIQMVNLGTSHGLASFRYSDDENAYNLALSGEDLYHDYATLRQFSSKLAQGCIVAIPTSYFSFCMSTTEASQKRYYMYLDKEYIRGFDYETLINAKYLPVLRSGEFIIKNLINDQNIDVGAVMMDDADADEQNEINDAKSTVSDKGTGNTDNEFLDKEAALLAHAKGRCESWRSGYMTNGRVNIEENTRILSDIVSYCYVNDWKPVLVTTPVHHTLNEQFSEEELNICYFDSMNRISAETGCPYLDLSHDLDLSYNPDYYSNSDHTNEAGGHAFMVRFKEFLSEIGYI